MSKSNNKDVGQGASEADSKQLLGKDGSSSNEMQQREDPGGVMGSPGKPDASGSSGDVDPSRTDSKKTSRDQDFHPSPVHYQIDAAEEEDAMKDMTWA
jgi:hypothetical protein